MSMECSAVIGGVAVMNKLTSDPVAKSQSQVALSKLGKPGGPLGTKKTLDVFTEEDEAILRSITHGDIPSANTSDTSIIRHIFCSQPGLACMLDLRSAKARMSAAAAAATQVMMGPSVASGTVIDACASMCARLLKCSRLFCACCVCVYICTVSADFIVYSSCTRALQAHCAHEISLNADSLCSVQLFSGSTLQVCYLVNSKATP